MVDGKAVSLRLRSGQALTGRSARFGMTSIFGLDFFMFGFLRFGFPSLGLLFND